MVKIIKAKDKNFSQEEVWDSIAYSWKSYRQKRIKIVEEFLKGKKGKIIDLGCGSGRNMIPNPKIEYYGVDFSEEQLKNAREYAKREKINAKFFKANVSDLKMFKDETFDYGLFIATLHCLETEEKRKKALRELWRVLKKGGEALITTWNSEDERFKEVGNHGGIYMSWKVDGKEYMRYYYLFKKEELLNLLKECGFKVIEFYEPKKDEKERFLRKNWILKVKKPFKI